MNAPTQTLPAAQPVAQPVEGLLAGLDLLEITRHDMVLQLRLNRPAKRNALSDPLIQQLHTAFVNLPEDIRAVVISGAGEHFCAGLDLSELVERDIGSGVLHSRMWHAAFDAIQKRKDAALKSIERYLAERFGPESTAAFVREAQIAGTLSYGHQRTLEIAMGLALAPQVRVVGVAPGLTLTSHMLSDERFQALHQQALLGRSSTPGDVASAVRFALENPAITGTSLLVDGGQHLMRFDRDFSLM